MDLKDTQADAALAPTGAGELEGKIAEWKGQYKDIFELQADDDGDNNELSGVRIICKSPGRSDMSRFIKDATSGDALKAQNNFFFGCLLYPDAEIIKKATDKKPGLIVALGNKLNELTGINQNFTVRKL